MKNRISITIGIFTLFIFFGIFLLNEKPSIQNEGFPSNQKIKKQPVILSDSLGSSMKIDSLMIDSIIIPQQQSSQKIDIKMLKKYIYHHKRPFVV
ncbi:MAG: hypothetical protein EAZ07_08770 [Cytophagales bacterium]|nr:MAG: hypothetical protein EAZ07_08770 [Cytophagales bacterium]